MLNSALTKLSETILGIGILAAIGLYVYMSKKKMTFKELWNELKGLENG